MEEKNPKTIQKTHEIGENGTKNMGIRSQEEGRLLKNRWKKLRC